MDSTEPRSTAQQPERAAPIFVDESGGRKRLLRRSGYGVAALCVAYVTMVGVALGGVPVTPSALPDAHRVPPHTETQSNAGSHPRLPGQPPRRPGHDVAAVDTASLGRDSHPVPSREPGGAPPVSTSESRTAHRNLPSNPGTDALSRGMSGVREPRDPSGATARTTVNTDEADSRVTAGGRLGTPRGVGAGTSRADDHATAPGATAPGVGSSPPAGPNGHSGASQPSQDDGTSPPPQDSANPPAQEESTVPEADSGDAAGSPQPQAQDD